jgi:cytochrome c oxidase subunit 2
MPGPEAPPHHAPRTRPWRAATAAGVLLTPLLLAGCAPEGITSQGREAERLYDFFMVAAAVVFTVVTGLIVWSIIRYRRRDDELPKQVHGNNRLELLWTILPAILVVVLFQQTIVAQNQVTAEVRDPAVTVDVLAYQWQWRFTYARPDGTPGVQVVGTAGQRPELVVPAGQTVRVRLTSADVIHAFYIPRTLYKRQAIPGRVSQFDLHFDEPGTYNGACTIFCGLDHAHMTFTVRVVPPSEYQQWLASRQPAAGGTG